MNGGTIKACVLQQMINRARPIYTYTEGLQWCIEACSALTAMHALHPMVIHRDLKCENILLITNESGQRVAKVGDFGLHALVEKHTLSNKGRMNDAGLKQMKKYDVLKNGVLESPFMNPAFPEAIEEDEEATFLWKMTG